MKFTVLGSSGFIGSALANCLLRAGIDYIEASRQKTLLDSVEPLGHVIYAIGTTADFRSKPFETVEAHVSLLISYLQRCKFESFTYLSSARVYKYATKAHEDVIIPINTQNPDELYNLSKLMGESLCLTLQNPQVRVIRLSNVLGNDYESQNFFSALLRESFEKKSICLRTSLESSKDFICLNDAVALIIKIAGSGTHRLYNLAAGKNISNHAIATLLKKKTDFPIVVEDSAPTVVFPEIDITRIRKEFKFEPASVTKKMDELVEKFAKGKS